MMTVSTTCEELASKNKDNRPTRDELWRRYHRAQPGSAVEDELVQQYLPLVKNIVGRMAMTLPAHVDLQDLYSAGLVGLLNAMRNFDPTNAASFETYARFRIRGSMFDELRRMDWVPRSVHEKARKVQRMIQELEQDKGRVPTEAEVAKGLKISAADYQEWLQEIRPATFVCLDAAPNADSDSNATQYESIADPRQENPIDGASRNELTALIAARLDQLPETQRKVLALYYFEDMRLREIAEVFGVTESRISQIHAQAILSIKSYLLKFDTCKV
jgi:RNA polymerase sigma factor FliA